MQHQWQMWLFLWAGGATFAAIEWWGVYPAQYAAIVTRGGVPRWIYLARTLLYLVGWPISLTHASLQNRRSWERVRIEHERAMAQLAVTPPTPPPDEPKVIVAPIELNRALGMIDTPQPELGKLLREEGLAAYIEALHVAGLERGRMAKVAEHPTLRAFAEAMQSIGPDSLNHVSDQLEDLILDGTQRTDLCRWTVVAMTLCPPASNQERR